VRVSAKRLLDAASYALRLSPPPRPEPVSPLRLAAEHYRTAAASQHLDAALARYRQRWINEPEALNPAERYELLRYAHAAVTQILYDSPERTEELLPLQELMDPLEDKFPEDVSDDEWERFRLELLRVLPDLDDPMRPSAAANGPEAYSDEKSDQPVFDLTDLDVFDHKEKGFGT
jgi:hypothetical protein